MEHARLSASAAHRWMACPGSVRIVECMPDSTSAAAEDGTRAHAIAAEWLQTGTRPDGEIPEGVEAYVNYVRALGGQLTVEMNLTSALVRLHPDLGGYSDAAVYCVETATLHSIDYKHGSGVMVDAVDNPQLLIYAVGALLTARVPVRAVHATIVQPNCFHPDGPIRTAVYDVIQLLDFIADLTERAYIITNVFETPLVPGAKQCRFCPAAAICPALREQSHALIKHQFTDVLSYDRELLAKALQSIPLLKLWISQVDSFAYAEAERGNPPPGYKLVDKRATRRWKNEGDAILWLQGLGYEKDKIGTWTLESPAQIEKIIDKVQRPALKARIDKASSGRTLVPDDDPRPVAQGLTADSFTVFEQPVEAQS